MNNKQTTKIPNKKQTPIKQESTKEEIKKEISQDN